MKNEKTIIQISFSFNTSLTRKDIERKLRLVKTASDNKFGKHNYEIHSCHLSRKLCLEKGFSTDVPDVFDKIFGDDYVCELSNEPDFITAMKNIDDHRRQLNKKADCIVIFDSNPTNVGLKRNLFTEPSLADTDIGIRTIEYYI